MFIPLVHAEESTVRPASLKVRKVTLEGEQTFLWLYLSTNIKTEIRYNEMDGEFSTMYVYDMQQLKIPLDSAQITSQERELLTNPSYTQITIRSRLKLELKNNVFLSKLSQEVNTDTKEVNQREQETKVGNFAIGLRVVIMSGVSLK